MYNHTPVTAFCFDFPLFKWMHFLLFKQLSVYPNREEISLLLCTISLISVSIYSNPFLSDMDPTDKAQSSPETTDIFNSWALIFPAHV